ncbi:MAG: 6-bladed beta-propeller [Gemmatimonas sp.]
MRFEKCFTGFGLLVVAGISACSNSRSDAPVRPAPTDTIKVATAPLTLESTDSAFISEPAALAVSRTAIYVADVGSNHVFEFDRSGKLVRRIGQKGRGPGEFVSTSSLAMVGDTMLAINDPALKRVSLYEIHRHEFGRIIPLPGLSLGIAATGDTLLFGVQDLTHKTSLARVVLRDGSMKQLGPIPASISNNPGVAASFPFGVAAAATSGYRVGFLGSNVIYHVDENGALIDSVVPAIRHRRGVPTDLAERLAMKGASAEVEAASTSSLITMARLPDGRTAVVHMDFTVERTSVTGKAYLSTISANGKSACIDLLIPTTEETRPMFAIHLDTLFAVQNIVQQKSSAVSTTVAAFKIPNCL